MAIGFDNSTSADNGPGYSSTSLTFAHTCAGSERILFVHVRGDNVSDTITGVTYSGVSMTLIDKIFVTGNRYQYLFYLIAPATGANNVVISSSSSIAILAESASYTGVRQSGVPDASVTNTAAAGSTTITYTTTTIDNNCWLITGMGASGGSITAGSGAFLRKIGTNTGSAILDSNGALTPAGSKSMTVTFASSAANGVMASFAPFTTNPDNLKSYNTNVKANVKSINTNAIANVKSFNTNV